MSYDVDWWDGTGALPTLYSLTADGAIVEWTCWVEGYYVCVQWGQQGGKMQTGKYVCTPKNAGRANATTPEQQAVLEAISKWKRQVRRKYYMDIGSARAGAGRTQAGMWSPMLAHKFKEHLNKVVYPCYEQPKLDGLRCFAYRKDGGVFLQSRGGKPYDVAHIQSYLEPYLDEGMILDGELYIHGMPLQDITSLVKRPQEMSQLLEYHCYDMASKEEDLSDIPFQARIGTLWQFFENIDNPMAHMFLKYVPTYTAGSYEEVIKYHNHFVGEGYEGAIIRSPNGTYDFGKRSTGLLKLKEFQDQEFPIIGWTQGKGKFENAPVFTCQTAEGKTFEVVPKGTQATRLQMLQDAPNLIGKLMTVRFFDWTTEGKPHHAVGVAIRLEEDMS